VQEAIDNPAIVQWYCSLKLELMLHLARRVLDAVRPDGGGDKDDYWACFEWGAGGITHLHVILWKTRSLRIENVVRPDACGRVPPHQSDAVLETEAVNRLNAYYSPHICEVNASKIQAVHDRRARAPGGDPRRKLPGEKDIGERQRAKLRKRVKGVPCEAARTPCGVDWAAFAEILWGAKDEAEEAAFDKRLDFVSDLADWCNMHDWHAPFAAGKPDRGQSCAKCTRETRGTSNEIYYCRGNFPRPCVRAGAAGLQEDPHRPGVFRLWLERNCAYMNAYSPLLILALLANMDIQAITSKWGVVEYVTKYVTKTCGSSKGSTLKVSEQQFDAALEKAKEGGKGIMSAMATMFNSQVSPALISQLEVSHMLWQMPTALASRTFAPIALKSDLRVVGAPEEVQRTGRPLRQASRAVRAAPHTNPRRHGRPSLDDLRGMGRAGLGGVAAAVLLVGVEGGHLQKVRARDLSRKGRRRQGDAPLLPRFFQAAGGR